MITLRVKGKDLKIYDDIRQLPFLRYIEYQKQMLIHTGIGSTIEDISSHFGTIFAYMNHEKYNEAINELENTYRNVYAILNGENTSINVFACLIHSIGNHICNDLSDSGIKNTVEKLKKIGITQGDVQETIKKVKKNSKKT